jgi:hypothetical protein
MKLMQKLRKKIIQCDEKIYIEMNKFNFHL